MGELYLLASIAVTCVAAATATATTTAAAAAATVRVAGVAAVLIRVQYGNHLHITRNYKLILIVVVEQTRLYSTIQ